MTFGQIRRARRRHRASPAGLSPDADIRELLDDDQDIPDGFELVTSWVFAGQGYLDLDRPRRPSRQRQGPGSAASIPQRRSGGTVIRKGLELAGEMES